MKRTPLALTLATVVVVAALAATLAVSADRNASPAPAVQATAQLPDPGVEEVGIPEAQEAAASVTFNTSCTATNECLCCPIYCSGTHTCIAQSNYVSCDGVTRYCGGDCC